MILFRQHITGTSLFQGYDIDGTQGPYTQHVDLVDVEFIEFDRLKTQNDLDDPFGLL